MGKEMQKVIQINNGLRAKMDDLENRSRNIRIYQEMEEDKAKMKTDLRTCIMIVIYKCQGSVTAATTFFPLDAARIRIPVDEKRESSSTHAILSEIVKEEGLLALYCGWFPVISSVCCSNFVYFYTFNSLKAMSVKGNVRATPSKDLLMGCIAGATNVFLTTPMWVVNTRLKLQEAKFRKEDIHQIEYKGILDAFRQIMAKEGLGTVWNGILPSLVLVCNPGIQFMFYQGLKRKASKAGQWIPSWEILMIGTFPGYTSGVRLIQSGDCNLVIWCSEVNQGR
ncbi:peroxisomal membrane protein PMP34-like [Scyliorhinus canicula]|uniref:peroxisomal membrane protein PMP34-like n=1 Tax=Scyliorhinus canicula TaxID=7830 RepID=UPI0018F2FBA8|nr:peroxisomal membrane protein PMP34-like [Scyliorhinus canicula]